MLYRTSLLFQPFLLVIDILGTLLFFWLRFKKLPQPRRILLIRLEHVGDVLLTTPALRALRKRFPTAQIDVVVRDFTAPILKRNKNINNVIVWNAPWLSSLGHKDSWAQSLRIICLLRNKSYDLAIDFHGDPRNIVLASLVAQYRVGFRIRGLGFLLNKCIPYRQQHAIDRNLSLINALGATTANRDIELSLSTADKRFARTRLASPAQWVCIAPGSGRKEKNWLTERWATVADALIERSKARIVFTGSAREHLLVQGIIDRMRHPAAALNLCGKTSLPQLAAVIQRCSLVLGPDSGTMHLARAMKTPLLGLFTVENPNEWGYHEPFYQHIKRARAEQITVTDVLTSVQKLHVLGRRTKD